MKKLLAYLFMASLIMSIGHAGDDVDYRGGSSFTKTRQVSENIYAASFDVDVTSTFVNLQRTALSIRVINNDTTATDTVYVNPTGSIALNVSGTAATTTDGSPIINLNINLETFGIAVGQLVVLTEGDDNDGLYSVIRIVGASVHLDRDLTVTNVGDQNFTIKSVAIEGVGKEMSFDVGTKVISFIADTTATPITLIVTYQKNS